MGTRMRAAVTAAAVIGALTAGISPAAAGVTECPRGGNPGGGQRCTTLSNGVLTVAGTGDGKSVEVDYYRKNGGALTGRVGWERSGRNTWGSWKNMNTTPFHYWEQWATSASCSPFIGKLQAGGDTYATPPLPRC